MSTNSAIKKLVQTERDMLDIAADLSHQEARYLVDTFYQMQEYRKATANQARAMSASDEPHATIDFVLRHVAALEEFVQGALLPYVKSSHPGRWMLSQHGVGPILAANMLAHLDITKAQTAGAFWRFAGLDPSLVWGKGQKRPYNAKLKTACWKLSDSWVKLGNKEGAFYAKVYRDRKALEVERNDAGQFTDQAAKALEEKNYREGTEARKAYEAGKLPDGRLDLRARRYAVKLFLAHLHEVMYRDHYGTPPPKPYAIEHLGHVHYIAPPGEASN